MRMLVIFVLAIVCIVQLAKPDYKDEYLDSQLLNEKLMNELMKCNSTTKEANDIISGDSLGTLIYW